MSTCHRENVGRFKNQGDCRRRHLGRGAVAKEHTIFIQPSTSMAYFCYNLFPCYNYDYLICATQSLEARLPDIPPNVHTHVHIMPLP